MDMIYDTRYDDIIMILRYSYCWEMGCGHIFTIFILIVPLVWVMCVNCGSYELVCITRPLRTLVVVRLLSGGTIEDNNYRMINVQWVLHFPMGHIGYVALYRGVISATLRLPKNHTSYMWSLI